MHPITHIGGPQTLGPILASPVLTKTVKQHVSLPNTFLDLDKLQCHPRPNLEKQKGRVIPPLGLPEKTTSATGPYLSETNGALLGPHVATPRDGLGQLRNVVLTIGLCLTL